LKSTSHILQRTCCEVNLCDCNNTLLAKSPRQRGELHVWFRDNGSAYKCFRI
jgi:hypothetical protein